MCRSGSSALADEVVVFRAMSSWSPDPRSGATHIRSTSDAQRRCVDIRRTCWAAASSSTSLTSDGNCADAISLAIAHWTGRATRMCSSRSRTS